jgi:hypothetical protein
MKKSLILFFVMFLIGIALIIAAWFTSYPVVLVSSNDYLFNNISILFWIGLPVILISMFLLTTILKSEVLCWLLTVGMVLAIFSLTYFYPTIWGIDSHWFRGLNENFIQTKDLTPVGVRGYYQWPFFFVLTSMTTSISGLSIEQYEFVIFALIGVLLASAIYLYSSKFSKKGSTISVISFFIITFFYLDYQSCPFSLAFGLLVLALAIEPYKMTKNGFITTVFLFLGIVFTHAFVPTFYILFQLLMFLYKRDKLNGLMLLVTTAIYSTYLLVFARDFLISGFNMLHTLTSEYSDMLSITVKPVSVPLDIFSQYFSRGITFALMGIAGIGFLYLLLKRKRRSIDILIVLTGVLYSAAGVVLYTLGSRTIPLIFIPVSLGISYLCTTRFKKVIQIIFLASLIFLPFIVIHSTFTESPLVYIQTNQEAKVDNFLLQKMNITEYNAVWADVGPSSYLSPLVPNTVFIETDYDKPYDNQTVVRYNFILYSTGLEQVLLTYNQSPNIVKADIGDHFDLLYDSKNVFIAYKPF